MARDFSPLEAQAPARLELPGEMAALVLVPRQALPLVRHQEQIRTL